MTSQPQFPTPLHQQAAERAVEFFSARQEAAAVLLVNSCARGTATPESDVDLAVLVAPDLPGAERAALERQWREVYATEPVFQRLQQSGHFARIHLDLIDGQYAPEEWDDGGGPDGFELEVGNQLVYSIPLCQGSDAFRRLQQVWLPYYGEPLRQRRLAMVRSACRYDLEHVEFYVKRELYFQAFDRHYKAWQEFLQALCIARRFYPIAYNKWIREQVAARMGLPELYAQLPALLEISRLESRALVEKAAALGGLLDEWTAQS